MQYHYVPLFVSLLLLFMIVLIIVLLVLNTTKGRHKKDCRRSNRISALSAVAVPVPDAKDRIPLIIWTYWNNEVIPPFINACVQSWKRYHPDFEVNVITPNTISKYMDFDPKSLHWNDIPARESDIIRINVLAKYGGIWSDASIILYGPYPCLEQIKSGAHEFVGYEIKSKQTDKRYPVIENWWFATTPGGEFITKWRDTFMDFGPSDTVQSRVDDLIQHKGTDPQNLGSPHYLFMHLCAQYVMQKVLDLSSLRIHLMIAEDGPFKYLVKNSWDNQKSVADLRKHKGEISVINKLRGCERPYAEKNWEEMF